MQNGVKITQHIFFLMEQLLNEKRRDFSFNHIFLSFGNYIELIIEYIIPEMSPNLIIKEVISFCLNVK